MGTTRHAIIHGPEAVARHMPSRHPLKPGRADAAVALLVRSGLAGGPDVTIVPPSRATDADLARVHDAAYVDVVERVSTSPSDERHLSASAREAIAHGFSRDGDNPTYPGLAHAARHACGGTIDAARMVLDGQAGVAFVPSAGASHHAMRSRASGFGTFNEAAVAIAAARAMGARVAYVDLDVHHGDGVEAAFATDPGTLTISIHESTRYLFPGPPGGLADKVGAGPGTGHAANVPLAPYSDDRAWVAAFESVVPPLLEAFRPDLLLVQCGADGYHADPLAHLLLSEAAYVHAAARLRDLSGGRLVAIGGGGYDAEATARIWAAMFATFTGAPVPHDWVAPAARAPVLDAAAAARVASENDAAVATVRALVFPHHGIG